MQQRAETTKSNILRVAEQEFSEKGFYGARINEIAKLSCANKALIYKYFGDKEELYKTVLFDVYERLGQMEGRIISDESSDYKQKLGSFVEIYFRFLEENPTYVRMVMWENLNHAQYFRERQVGKTKDPMLKELEKIVEQAKADHSIPQSIDSKQLMLTLIACAFNYSSNMDTLSEIVGEDLQLPENRIKRVESVKDMLFSYMNLGDNK